MIDALTTDTRIAPENLGNKRLYFADQPYTAKTLDEMYDLDRQWLARFAHVRRPYKHPLGFMAVNVRRYLVWRRDNAAVQIAA